MGTRLLNEIALLIQFLSKLVLKLFRVFGPKFQAVLVVTPQLFTPWIVPGPTSTKSPGF